MWRVFKKCHTDKTPTHTSQPSSMEIVTLAAAFLLSASAASGEYVYVENPMGWHSAQRYCRDHYVDLASVMSHKVGERLRIKGMFWTGLYWELTQWMNSGGVKAIEPPWAEGQLGLLGGCASGCWRQCEDDKKGLHKEPCSQNRPFLCYNLILPQARLTWEQALTSCRNNGTLLASLQSQNKHLFGLSRLQKSLSERVWIGLRFLAGQWVWIDGHRFKFQAWNGEHEEHLCPALNRCGTLTRGGQWESWDCADKLHFLCQ